MKVFEMLTGLFNDSEVMILDFNQIPSDAPPYKNIRLFFEKSRDHGIDPKLPQNRQRFNNYFLNKSGKRYLISRYAEDRIEMLKGSKIAEEGRTIHLGIDIFSKNLETVFAPLNAEIVATGNEEGGHSFGHYLILKPDPELTQNYIFLGHLSKTLPPLGTVTRGQKIAQLGDYTNGENGGWSRHLHVQLLSSLPDNGILPPGYSSRENLSQNMMKYPDPSLLAFE
ncbi:MAG: peptidoglycan DD-metalloendopeptidase family protein [Candidatus Colwellbacteria bacterium]|nr:peptidoglycan DD-metalloendopeptidase family protein [Candidatus Colwellbacteria bacterium]